MSSIKTIVISKQLVKEDPEFFDTNKDDIKMDTKESQDGFIQGDGFIPGDIIFEDTPIDNKVIINNDGEFNIVSSDMNDDDESMLDENIQDSEEESEEEIESIQESDDESMLEENIEESEEESEESGEDKDKQDGGGFGDMTRIDLQEISKLKWTRKNHMEYINLKISK